MIEVSLPVYIALWVGIVVVLLTTVIIITRALNIRGKSAGLDADLVAMRMERIESLLAGASDTEWSLAIIEADKLLDYLLKARHIAGTTLGERLKVACYKHKELRNVWEAHKVRNRIVHEHSVQLAKRDAMRYWQQYKSAYKVLMR
ncbi:MAG: hypothetical protein ACPGO5_04620 [Patescibacteria group bacterium]